MRCATNLSSIVVVFLCIIFQPHAYSLQTAETEYSSQDYAHKFCRYMTNTPEPRVLIYNRIPKCGSQTMTNILLQIQHHDSSIDQTARWRQYWWPHDMDANASHAAQFAKTVKKRLTKKERVRISGHWYWHSFDALDFGLSSHSDVEYINILRECSPRFKSQLLFELFDTKEAKASRMKGTLAVHQSALLYQDLTVPSECIEDISCLENVFRKRILEENRDNLTGMMVEYLSGTKSMREEGNSYYKGALKHLNKINSSDEGYTALGFLEFYKESLELLECAYPTFFRNALSIYLEQKTHLHRSSVSHDPALYNHSNFDRVLQPLCDIADNKLYKIALEQFWGKIMLIRKNRDACCRKLPPT
jgi:hypothetical protein